MPKFAQHWTNINYPIKLKSHSVPNTVNKEKLHQIQYDNISDIRYTEMILKSEWSWTEDNKGYHKHS